MKIINCPGGTPLTYAIQKCLVEKFCFKDSVKADVKWTWFNNTEQKCELMESIRGEDCFIIQDFANQDLIYTVNDSLMALFICIDTVKRAGAKRISLLIPTFPYSRQHKKQCREGLTASMISRFIDSLGVKNIITLDLHSRELENSFQNVVIENLHPSYQIIKELRKLTDIKDLIVVAPDTGSSERNKFFANILNSDLAIIYKERDYKSYMNNSCNIKSMKLLGDVENRNCVIFDDMIDTGGTILKAAELLKYKKANDIFICSSLPFFTAGSIESFDKANRDGLFVKVISTNAVNHPKLFEKEWFQCADLTKFFATVITKIYNDSSISELLDSKNIISRLLDTK